MAQGASQLASAVSDRRVDVVKELLSSGANPNDKDERGEEALLIATSTDQFTIANLLVEHGANIWVASKLGFTPGLLAYTTHLPPGSVEGQACEEFVNKLKNAGYPWPPPWQDEVAAMRNTGAWPPSTARQR